jgi:hypothetical protein
VLRPKVHTAIAAKGAVFRAPGLDGQAAQRLHKVTKTHACRAQIGAKVTGQAKPESSVLRDLKIQQDPLDDAARRDLVRKIVKDLPHGANGDTLAALDAQKQPIFTCKLLNNL